MIETMRAVCLVVMLAACGGGHGTATPDGGSPDGPTESGIDAGGGSGALGVDPTFGADGLATANLDGAMDGLARIARQPDGKYIAVGGTQEAVLVLRLTSDGMLDPTFGTQGALQLPWGMARAGVRSNRYGVALQSDGKIVIAAQLNGRFGGSTGGVVARITTDGQLDTSFGGTGVVMAPGSSGFFDAVAVQADGAIVAGGNVLSRFNPDGSRDTSFGGAISPPILDLAIESDGTIVGITATTIVRYTTAGALDSTFGTAGIASVPSFGSGDSLYGVALQSDGKIVVAGRLATTLASSENFTIARYTTAGTPDPTFGTAGFVQDGSSNPTAANGLGIQSDGKIVATGLAQFGASIGSLVRVTTTGALDTTFGTGGLGNTCGTASNIVFDPDGTMTSTATVASLPTKWLVCKVSATGTVFSTPGTTGGSFDTGTAVAFQADGKLVVGGRNDIHGPALVRFGADGTVDTSFGTDGAVFPSSGALYQVNAVVVQPAGGIVVSGIATTAHNDELIALRYTPDGVLDTSFGTNGLASVSAGLDAQTYAMAGTAGGKIVVAGTTNIDREFAIARFTVDGAPDPSFGDNGVATSAFGSGTNMAQLVAVAPDDSVIALGTTSHPTAFSLVKLTPAGELDATFGTSGVASLPGTPLATPLAIALQSDGAVLALFGQITGVYQLVRVLPDGSLDTSFGTAGTATISAGGNDYSNERAGLIQLPDGTIMVGVASTSDGLTEAATLVHLTAAGALDSNSIERLSLTRGASAIHGLALDANGKLIAVGRAWTDAGDSDIAVLRFTM
jgi:uncharacterized delta-60 repeat protein